VSQGYIVRDDLAIESSLSIVVKKIKIIQYISERISFGAVKTVSALRTTRLKAY